MKVAVVGAGIFGCTVAFRLAELKIDVTLFEEKPFIMQAASRINQRRLHSGYHYPRSPETVNDLQRSISQFMNYYGDATYTCKDHIYCIATDDSLTSPSEFLKFCDQQKLPYELISNTRFDELFTDAVALAVKTPERLIDTNKLHEILMSEFTKQKNHLTLQMKTKFLPSMIDDFDLVINATYSKINFLTPDNKQEDYQFELCEKIIVKPPYHLTDLSAVIMDGPFCCIDTMNNSSMSLLGNVKYAIQSTAVGKSIPDYMAWKDKVDTSLKYEDKITMFDAFIGAGSVFFKGFDECTYVGSFYTHRAVLPNVEQTDERLTHIRWVHPKIINIFSGKIDTCVRVAEDIIKEIKQ